MNVIFSSETWWLGKLRKKNKTSCRNGLIVDSTKITRKQRLTEEEHI